MTTKYIVYNPATGENTYVNSESEAKQLFLQYVADFVAPYFHNSPYTLADVDEAGVEVNSAGGLTVHDILLNTL